MRNTTVLLICRNLCYPPQTEETWLKFWEDDNVFEKALEKRKNSPLFILHDGPPYANGDIHLGTALQTASRFCPSSSR